MKLLKKNYKKILFIFLAFYAISIFISQEQTLAQYKNDVNSYETQIAQQQRAKQELTALKENINSPEYIEEIAREKLDMYLPNEKVYIDIEK